MYYNCLVKYFDFVNNYFNYDLLKKFNLTNYISTPHTNSNTNSKNSKQVALGSIYQSHPPGFQDTKKTANAVLNSKMANADTGATGTYIATRDMSCVDNVIPCSASSQIEVQVANGQNIMYTRWFYFESMHLSKPKRFVTFSQSAGRLRIQRLIRCREG